VASTIATNSLSIAGSSQPPISGPPYPRRLAQRAAAPSAASLSAASAISAIDHTGSPHSHHSASASGMRDNVSACASHTRRVYHARRAWYGGRMKITIRYCNS